MCVMRLWVFWAVAVIGCYQVPQSNESCTITCSGAIDSCPGDLSCEGGYCVAPGQVCRPAFVDVAAGTGFACAIDEAGALWCWGSNLRTQIAAGNQISYPLATRVDTTRRWQVLDAGGEHVCGIAEGKLLCWGANDHGQVSDTVSGDVASPLEIAIAGGPATWTRVATGARSTCAIGDGQLYCWGSNSSGQLGDGTQTDRGVPTLVLGGVTDWVDVALGDAHACAISQGNGVHCWGYNGSGEIGPGANSPQLSPHSVGVMATTLAVSESATCATTSAGELVCWGSNYFGELGESNAGIGSSSTPVVATATTGWTAVAASIDTLCGLRDGQIVCWGSTRLGGLGNGFWSQTTSERAFAVVGGTMGATKLSLGWNGNIDVVSGNDQRDLTLACGVIASDVVCWGDNRFGQLAMGTATLALEPQPVAGNHMFSDLQVGHSHACGVEAGVVSCWGSTEIGAATGVLAGGSTKACNPNLDCDVATPKQLNFFSPNATAVALGFGHTCAFHAGAITCWGDNSAQQLISTTPAPPRERDIPAPGGATWTGIMQTGRNGQCGAYRSGMIDATACWGYVLQQRSNATPIAALNGAKALALGSTLGGAVFDCILDANSALLCQGDNSYGEYGNGTTSAVGTLTAVNPPRSYIALATNTNTPTLCGIRSDGALECWGANDRGQAGAPAGGNRLSPNQLPGLAACTAVAVGLLHACAICNGSILCWGDNRFGQLGTGSLDADPRPDPQVISGPPAQGAWVQIAAGLRFTCARSDTGLAQCWGFDAHAALGNGARSANLPVTVAARPTQ